MIERLSLFVLALLTSSCTQTVPNAQVCADKGILGAKCAFTRNGPESKLAKLQWDRTRVGWFCMDARDFGKYQKFIEDACAHDKNCVDEVFNFVKGLKQ